MKIIKEDQNLMVIKDKSIVAFFVGAIFVLGGFLVILKPDFFTNKPSIWSGFVGILIGLFVVFVAKITTITLDKITRKIVFEWKTIISKKSREYDLGSIKQLELQQVYTSNSKSGGGYSNKLVFLLDNGEEVPLNPNSSSVVSVGGRQIITGKGIGLKISSFLDIPFQERRLPTVNEILSTIQSSIKNNAEEIEMENNKKE